MAGHLLFNSGSNKSSLAPQVKWLDNTFNVPLFGISFMLVSQRFIIHLFFLK
jgi:hypothetical protein